jgi:hypothetical protein
MTRRACEYAEHVRQRQRFAERHARSLLEGFASSQGLWRMRSNLPDKESY